MGTGDVPGARAQLAMTAFDGTLVVVGGCTTTDVLTDAYVYDIASGRWRRLPDCPAARRATLTPEPFRVPAERLSAETIAGGLVAVLGPCGFATMDVADPKATWQQPLPDVPGLTCHTLTRVRRLGAAPCRTLYAWGGRRTDRSGADGGALREV